MSQISLKRLASDLVQSSAQKRIRSGSLPADASSVRARQSAVYCLASALAGRPLAECKDSLELLRAMRDAIKAHRLLLQGTGMLYGDVTRDNIIIMHPLQHAEGFHWVLKRADMDAIREYVEPQRSKSHHMPGTTVHTALEILRNKLKPENTVLSTYRHDPESFFYVFLDLCLSCGWPMHTKREDELQYWYMGSPTQVYSVKIAYMAEVDHVLLPLFSPRFEMLRELAEGLRNLLFPYRNGRLTIFTPYEDEHVLYNGAFERHIALQEPQS